MDNLFQSKWFLRVISLVLAISLYFIATYEPNKTDNKSLLPSFTKETEQLEDIPLNVRMDSEKYVVSGLPEYVKVSLEARASVLAPIIRQKNFTAYVDLNDLGEGEHTVDVRYENIPDDVTVYIDPKTIDVIIEERASGTFAVEVDFVNLDKLPIDYEIGDIQISPETVTIVSSSSVIDRVAMVKVYVDVTDMKESIRNREVPISVSDIQGNDLNVRVEPSSVVISVQNERPSKKVSVSVATKGELPEGLTLVSAEVVDELDVFGKHARLAELEEIMTEEIDLSKVETTGELEVPIVRPDGIVTNDDTVKVQIVLEQSRLFEDIAIEIIGQLERVITFIKPDKGSIDVAAKGSDAIIAGLKPTDIRPFVDVTNLTNGQHQLKIELTGPDDVVYELMEKTVTIKIDEKKDEATEVEP